jgi:two-component system, chemotaxis family, CheB/CheR fusion protein
MADRSDDGLAQLVVVGASAGGVEALGTLVATLPADFPAPIVLAQHLDRTRPSHLAEILERRSTLPVRTVETELPLEPGVVYVVPSNRDVTITDHTVGVQGGADAGPMPSIDRLLETAARVYGERLVAVVLTGAGSDGTAGARAVKETGGTVVIQNPETASYPTMPQSLAPTTVDLVADIEDMGRLLYDLVVGAFAPTQAAEEGLLRTFLDQLRERSGVDFNSYKMPTIMRRLQRRMVATGADDLDSYVHQLQTRPDEYQRLISSFLIKVTQFFRDPELFTYLREQVVPSLVAEARQRGNDLRIWSAGCATGEEAYSLAILVSEALGDELDEFNVRIFATDLDLDAVAYARRGVYPASALVDVPADLIERYFSDLNGDFEVRKRLRALTVFGQHDLGQRAPFPRIDLALCRNVLIYFTNDLQRRALQLFAFSLRTGGYLVLGQAETTSPLGQYFSADHPRLRIYRRVGERVLIPPSRVKEGALAPPRLVPVRRPRPGIDLGRPPRDLRRPSTSSERAEGLLFRLPLGVVVVDRRYDVVTINAFARRAFGIHATAIGEDFVHLVQGVDPSRLRSAIDAAFRGEAGWLDEVAIVEAGSGEIRYVEITCQAERVEGDGGPIEAVLVTIADVSARVQQRRALEAEEARRGEEVGQLSAQMERLAETNRRLIEANQDLTGTNAELRSANDEFLISNEEAQAATEEVETLNEELQATNEELETLNEELQATVEELNTTNDDLQARSIELQDLTISLEGQRRASEAERARLSAMLTSMPDAVLVVDRAGRRVLSNAAYDHLFGLGTAEVEPQDEAGRPLPPDQTPQWRAARGEPFRMEFTLAGPGGSRRWLEASGKPIGSGEQGEGGVIVVRDISTRSLRRLQEESLALVGHELRAPLTALQGYLQMLARRGGIQDEGARELVERAREQAGRLDGLIDELADATRSEQGQLAIEPRPIDLVPLTRRVVEIAQTLTREQSFDLSASEDSLTIEADPGRVEQVLLNLLTNAVRHAPTSQRIDVRLREVDNQAEVQVQDYGPGIAAADLPNVFSRFFQVGRARGNQGGLGLGLYISRQIVEAHGGTIEASSRPGRGATFTVRLPLAP